MACGRRWRAVLGRCIREEPSVVEDQAKICSPSQYPHPVCKPDLEQIPNLRSNGARLLQGVDGPIRLAVACLGLGISSQDSVEYTDRLRVGLAHRCFLLV